jgi:hypothetical protein
MHPSKPIEQQMINRCTPIMWSYGNKKFLTKERSVG